jgi:hypothetical protein
MINIIFPKKYKKQYNELIRLTSKTSITDDEYLKITLLFQILTRFISGKYMEYIKSSANAFSNYYKCESLFNEFKQDKELLKKRISTFSIKDDKKRNKVIEKQVKLDKCNNISLKFIQEALKLNNNKIKYSRRFKIY